MQQIIYLLFYSIKNCKEFHTLPNAFSALYHLCLSMIHLILPFRNRYYYDHNSDALQTVPRQMVYASRCARKLQMNV